MPFLYLGYHHVQGVSEHTAFLAAAESLRQDRKRQEVARRMDRFNTTQQSLTSSFATPSYFTVNFTNPYGQQATFNVHILARGEKPQPPPEIVPFVPPQAPLQGVGALACSDILAQSFA